MLQNFYGEGTGVPVPAPTSLVTPRSYFYIPYKLLWTICTTMGVQTRNAVWFQVRDDMR